MRARLSSLLGVPALYDLDRLDLTARSTLVEPAQESVTRLLRSLRDPTIVQALGLKGLHLLDDRGNPARVIYSFTLYEKTAGANRVRVQTDSFDQPFDINAGARLDLGSSAKLRALISYLEVVAALHAWLAPLGPDELRAIEVHKRDQLTAWADRVSRPSPRQEAPADAGRLDGAAVLGESRGGLRHRRRPAGLPQLRARGRRAHHVGARRLPQFGEPRVHPADAGRRQLPPLPGSPSPSAASSRTPRIRAARPTSRASPTARAASSSASSTGSTRARPRRRPST